MLVEVHPFFISASCRGASRNLSVRAWGTLVCGTACTKSIVNGQSLRTLFSQMSDVEAGGATVFPDFGAAIWPKKVKSVYVFCLISPLLLLSLP